VRNFIELTIVMALVAVPAEILEKWYGVNWLIGAGIAAAIVYPSAWWYWRRRPQVPEHERQRQEAVCMILMGLSGLILSSLFLVGLTLMLRDHVAHPYPALDWWWSGFWTNLVAMGFCLLLTAFFFTMCWSALFEYLRLRRNAASDTRVRAEAAAIRQAAMAYRASTEAESARPAVEPEPERQRSPKRRHVH
jgi:hypothetical protein